MVTYNGQVSDVWYKTNGITGSVQLATSQERIEKHSEKAPKKPNNFLHELKKPTTTAAAEASDSALHDPHPSSHHHHNGILDLPQYSSVQR